MIRVISLPSRVRSNSVETTMNFAATSAGRDNAYFPRVETIVDPGFPLRVFEGGDAVCEGEAVLALVQDIFRRIPNVQHGLMVRLSRSLVEDF